MKFLVVICGAISDWRIVRAHPIASIMGRRETGSLLSKKSFARQDLSNRLKPSLRTKMLFARCSSCPRPRGRRRPRRERRRFGVRFAVTRSVALASISAYIAKLRSLCGNTFAHVVPDPILCRRALKRPNLRYRSNAGCEAAWTQTARCHWVVR